MECWLGWLWSSLHFYYTRVLLNCIAHTLKFLAHARPFTIQRTIFTVLSLKAVSFGSTWRMWKGTVLRTGQQQEALSLDAYGTNLRLSPLHNSVDPKSSSPGVPLSKWERLLTGEQCWQCSETPRCWCEMRFMLKAKQLMGPHSERSTGTQIYLRYLG